MEYDTVVVPKSFPSLLVRCDDGSVEEVYDFPIGFPDDSFERRRYFKFTFCLVQDGRIYTVWEGYAGFTVRVHEELDVVGREIGMIFGKGVRSYYDVLKFVGMFSVTNFSGGNPLSGNFVTTGFVGCGE